MYNLSGVSVKALRKDCLSRLRTIHSKCCICCCSASLYRKPEI